MSTYEVTGIRIDNDTGHRSHFCKRIEMIFPRGVDVTRWFMDALDELEPWSTYTVTGWRGISARR